MLAAILFLSAFGVIGVCLLIERLLYFPCCPEGITVICEAGEGGTEMLIRSLRHCFPGAEIRIAADGEAAAIAEKMGAEVISSPPPAHRSPRE